MLGSLLTAVGHGRSSKDSCGLADNDFTTNISTVGEADANQKIADIGVTTHMVGRTSFGP